VVGAGDVNNDGAREVFEAAESHGPERTLLALALPDKGLTVVGDGVARLTDLQELRLDRNALTRVPAAMGVLDYLRVLNLNDNRLETLPDELGDLGDLQWLALGNNRLTRLPATFANLANLLMLFLGGVLRLRGVLCGVRGAVVLCDVTWSGCWRWVDDVGVGAGNRLDDAGAGVVVEMFAGHALFLHGESSGCW